MNLPNSIKITGKKVDHVMNMIDGWDDRDPIGITDDYAIFPMWTVPDRKKQAETCTKQCIYRSDWDNERFGFGLELFSVRNSEGKGVCTILGIEAIKGIRHRANDMYIPYINSRPDGVDRIYVFPNGTPYLILEICPWNSVGSNMHEPVSQEVLSWLNSLTRPIGALDSYNVTSTAMRIDAKNFIKENQEVFIDG